MKLETILFRRGCARSDAKRDAGLTLPEDVTYITGLRYGSNEENSLHICYPKEAASPLPTIVSFHGGGYVYGSADVYKFYCADLARRGFTVINFNYRLAPEYKFPTPLEDLNAVMEWAIRNQNAYPIDVGNVFLLGDSAGAQLASQYAAIYSNPAYADIMGIYPPKFTLRALGLNCGMYESDAEHLGNTEYFTSNPEAFGEMLRPLDYITESYPPAYLLSSPGDFLLGNCAPMAELINERGGTAEYRIYGESETGHVFHVDLRNPYAKEANDDETAFFMRYVK